MMYAGIILAFMRRDRPELSLGERLPMMVPCSLAFLRVWTSLPVGSFVFGIPLGIRADPLRSKPARPWIFGP